MTRIKGSFLDPKPISILFFTLFLHLSLSLYLPPPSLPHPVPSPTGLTLPHPPDPLVLHRTLSFPPTVIAVKFYSYGPRNDLLHVQHLLSFAAATAAISKPHDAIPRNRPLHYAGEDRALELDFNPGKGMTWGYWILVLDAMKELIKWYESRDFLFEVRIFEKGKVPRAGGAGTKHFPYFPDVFYYGVDLIERSKDLLSDNRDFYVPMLYVLEDIYNFHENRSEVVKEYAWPDQDKGLRIGAMGPGTG
ncbi:MAG: hypothetical protein LQ337_002161 [Flavoplaca oasis]|nr:MAG: hypothetical protein LQ337_002161 [Flavoplaca oasis]